MYVAVDIGGTKTLLAVFDQTGQVTYQHKFPTPPKYPDFLATLKQQAALLPAEGLSLAAAAIPGRLNRATGEVLAYGTLTWPPAPIKADLERALGLPVIIENDSKLAGLSEGLLLINDFKKVLYVTVSTGISNALIMNGIIDPSLEDSEGGQLLVDDNGQMRQWEDVASGSAIVAKYGKRASEIDDPQIWSEIAAKLSVGILDLITVIQPEVIVFGGGVGAHFAKFEEPLKKHLANLANGLTPIPELRVAQRPDDAVIYGCYELIKRSLAQTAPSAASEANDGQAPAAS